MDPTLPAALFMESSDPVLIVRSDGEILWRNGAADRLARAVRKDLSLEGARLSDLVEPADAVSILKTTYFGCIEARFSPPSSLPAQTAVVVDTGAVDLEGEQFLVTFKAASPDLLRPQGGDDMLAGIAHDLRNPLGAIFGYADALLDTAAGEGLTPPQRDVLVRLRKTTIRAVELIRNYQLLLQLRATALRETPTSVDLNEAVTTVIEETWREDGNALDLRTELLGESIPVVAERFHVERIVANLFGNTLKYTPKGGKIRITTFRDGAYGALTVQNSGPPIPAEDIPHLFERYRRAGNSKGKRGTGLGLFIVKYIADRLGGRVTATSDAREGTIMTIRLPLRRG